MKPVHASQGVHQLTSTGDGLIAQSACKVRTRFVFIPGKHGPMTGPSRACGRHCLQQRASQTSHCAACTTRARLQRDGDLVGPARVVAAGRGRRQWRPQVGDLEAHRQRLPAHVARRARVRRRRDALPARLGRERALRRHLHTAHLVSAFNSQAPKNQSKSYLGRVAVNMPYAGTCTCIHFAKNSTRCCRKALSGRLGALWHLHS